MDPFSVSVGIFAILGAGGKLGSALKRIIALKDAPSDLLALDNEREKILNIVEAVDMIHRNSRTELLHPGLIQSLECMKTTALELECFIVYDLTKIEGDEPRVDKSRWFRALPKIQEFKAKLESDKTDLSLNLHILTSFCSLAVDRNIGQFNAQSQKLDALIRQMFQHQIERQVQLEDSEAGNRKNQLEVSPQSLTNQRIGDSAKVYSEGQSEAHSKADEGTVALLQARSTNSSSFVHRTPISMSTKRLNRCDLDCQCSCHQYHYLQTPRCLSQLVGSLFLGFDGTPWSAKRCSDPFCRAGMMRISCNYAFPRWLVGRVLQLYMKYSQAQGPELNLRTMRLRDFSDRPFALLAGAFTGKRNNATVEIKRMIGCGEASVLDVTSDGLTYLHCALEFGHLELVKLLIKYEADPFYRTANGESSYTIAWRQMLCSGENSELSSLFDQSELALFHFSELHRAFLGLSGVTFKSALDAVNRDAIDSLDATSRATLSWAAERGDENAVAQLLKCGADPNKADADGWTPLHFAASIGSTHCVKQLIDAKAHVDARNHDGETALHVAARDGRAELLDLLVSNGASLHNVDESGKTILDDAIFWGETRSVQKLLSLKPGSLFEECNTLTTFDRTALFSNTAILHALWPAATGDILDSNQRQVIETALGHARWRKEIHENGGDIHPRFQLCDDPTEWFEVFEELANRFLYPNGREDIEEVTTDESWTDESDFGDEDDDAERVAETEDCNEDVTSEGHDGQDSDDEDVWEDTRET